MVPGARCRVPGAWVVALVLMLSSVAAAQHPAFRLKGRVTTEGGEPIANADVRLEAMFGYAAGTFAGQRVFATRTNGKGEWNVGAMQPGIWQVDVMAPGYLPETVALPIRILTTVSMGTSGMTLIWDLILKPVRPADDPKGEFLMEVARAAREGDTDAVRSALGRLPDDPDGDYLAAAGRVARLRRHAQPDTRQGRAEIPLGRHRRSGDD